ncbi:M14 metallopeptidase family protein [Phaeodactylibacter luteus]|uniref:Zinc carboxypeptidase n=1 Tax=Phaeodactylibacter luteus TaxID=1564516 RepID=A0A5C6RLE9_9BACT|nr:M14 metallopeptidase family protein [Phaeodactylibacter luteus]TXB63057.1 zinc carboxypeptidase [Phaeodactylibacter luteus]
MKRWISLAALLVWALSAWAQRPLTYYLPDIEYDAQVPSPEAFFGHQIGEWHLTHDKLVYYFKALADSSPRVTYTEYARSYEHRPLIYLTITSEKNHSRLEEIRAAHVALSDPASDQKVEDGQPVVLYQGFSIHGNEPSGGNAAPLVAYYLAAGQSDEVLQTLDNAVVLLDPCFNPDGFNRFSTWANMHKNKNLTADPQDREYSEAWPGGRTNHYWFDLNRDWLLVQHPESQGRIRTFHQWKPNVLTDHHEMGSNATFFFMPGIPSRTNPITPPLNQELTARIGDYHAEALDEIGSLYYTKESFDDFYYGKGSTYPDANGGIGILFEQASSRGHVQETDNGLLTFPFTIRNQVRTALSTQKAGVALRKDLLQYQRDFYRDGLAEARKGENGAFVFGETADPVRLQAFLDLLLQHQIEVYELKGQAGRFKPGAAYVVPLEQPQYRLVRGIFETMTTFQDSIFYDVSSWTLPLAFEIPYAPIARKDFNRNSLGGRYNGQLALKNQPVPQRSSYAYLLEWEHYSAPAALYAIMNGGLRAKVASEPFELEGKAYARGTVMVPVQGQDKGADEVYELMRQVAEQHKAVIIGVGTGLTPQGIDLGSRSFELLKKPDVLLIVGPGASPYEAGEAWHLLDQRYGIPVTMIEQEDVGRADLSRYTSIIMVDGGYSGLGSRGSSNIRDWVKGGGTLIAWKDAVSWAKGQGLAEVKMRSQDSQEQGRRPYAKISDDLGSDRIGGAIFQVEADLSHPLFYGYQREAIPIFQRGTLAIAPAENQYASPAVYAENPLLSGYARPEHLKKLGGSAAAIVSGAGRGKVICLSFNPNFRAFWYGTNRVLANSIFYGHTISGAAVERASGSPERGE